MSANIRFDGPWMKEVVGERTTVTGRICVTGAIALLPGVRVHVKGEGLEWTADSRETFGLAWLPRGSYRFRIYLPTERPAGRFRYKVGLVHRQSMADRIVESLEGAIDLPAVGREPSTGKMAFSCEALPPTEPIDGLPWKRGYGDWFFRHFDHAATTIQSYLLGDSPKLRGRILDVGCRDGITDLGLALRTGCEELIGLLNDQVAGGGIDVDALIALAEGGITHTPRFAQHCSWSAKGP